MEGTSGPGLGTCALNRGTLQRELKRFFLLSMSLSQPLGATVGEEISLPDQKMSLFHRFLLQRTKLSKAL